MGIGDVSKRVLLGRKLRSSQLGETLLPKRIALPVFASDALSSVAYAPDEIFIMLSLAGASAYVWSWKIGIAVALVMIAVVASYRQTVHAYPSGGGDYEVATVNLGRTAGTTVASALLVDYVLTVAVSISSGAQYAASAIPSLSGHEVIVATVAVVLLMSMNLRGIRESGSFFAIPTYAFMVAILGMALFGLYRLAMGDLPEVESAAFTMEVEPGYGDSMTTFALLFLLARAFSSGCAALTGVEAISNGVPAFRRPKSRNAATTLLLLALIAVTMMLSIIVLANQMGLQMVDPDDLERLTVNGAPLPAGYDQHTAISQIADALFQDFRLGFYFVVTVTGIILVLAANTAFNGFPVLGSILAKDGYAPRALGSRGDRLAYSNGILFLAVMAIVLIVAFDAEPTRLIQLYIVGVFVSFNLSQLGMIRHWTRHLRSERDPAVRRKMYQSRIINAIGLSMTAVVLVIVLITKFFAGAWITILAMIVFFLIMRGIHKHYESVNEELAADEEDKVMPTRVHAIVLVSKLHKPTLRALAFAKATRPNVLEGVYVSTDAAATARLLEEWDDRNIDVPLKVLHSPYRELVRPIVEYATEIRQANPRGVVSVYIPEYVVGRWWEQLLHNQTALRLKGRLLFTPGVMVTSVPYQLRSSELVLDREDQSGFWVRPTDLREGGGRNPSNRSNRQIQR
ncbi:amino acid permease [Nocardioides sp. MAH-18]|uniref:Amino acid permease n=1 Tax=Nocardioides agri TaxID=2682843 RepID=A0A6L6XWK5_9ACTN|nr:APC family permease [Nocardioides sp. CGMCC 1.13656]MBA2952448.1 APC family permease [Nocardioides sp. CGMCC 1.13656]MVQ51610.1 amino acid permease [Nocardioides sp. MAH-18]